MRPKMHEDLCDRWCTFLSSHLGVSRPLAVVVWRAVTGSTHPPVRALLYQWHHLNRTQYHSTEAAYLSSNALMAPRRFVQVLEELQQTGALTLHECNAVIEAILHYTTRTGEWTDAPRQQTQE